MAKLGNNLNYKNKIGVLGGSFDPAHKGHLVISKEAAKRFKLKNCDLFTPFRFNYNPFGSSLCIFKISAIRKIFNNPETNQLRADNGRMHIIENFNWQKIAKLYEDLIYKTIDEFQC